MDDEDEVDILGDFTLENLLTKNDNRIWSCYEGDNEYPSSNWLQESTSQCWQDDRTLCSYSSTSNLLMPSSSSSVGSPDKDTSWTDKECYLLDKGLELFGRSWSRLAQYIGSKTSQQVRARVKSGGGGLLAGISSPELSTCAVLDNQLSSINCAELIDDMQIPASIEEVIATVTTAKPTVPSPSPRQRLNSGSGSASFPGSVHSSHNASSVTAIKKSRGRPRKEGTDRRGQKMVKRKEDRRGRRRRRRRGGGNNRTITECSSSEELRMNRPYVLPDEQNSITLPSGEQVIRIQPNSQEDDEEIDIEEGSDCEVEQEEVKIDTTVVEDFQLESVVETKQEVPTVPVYTAQSAIQNHQAAVLSKYMQTIQERLERIYSLPPPTEELQLNFDIVSEEEMKLHPEFFAKSENFNRYLRIRSHIVNTWLETKPNYVTKTSVRFGLKNCGDVNLISRVHAYLEQKGYINFGCQQCHYLTASSQATKHSNVDTSIKPAESNSENAKVPENIGVELKQRMSARKRMPCFRFRSADDEESSRSLLIKRVVKENRGKSQHEKMDLITCREFSEDNPEPFCTVMKASALILANFHGSSNMQSEVIGLLGGIYEQGAKRLEIHLAMPCRSITADRVGCEICPVSQSEASTAIEGRGLAVVGWYHSHPGFKPQPSAVDVRTQADYQRWFSGDLTVDQRLVNGGSSFDQSRNSGESIVNHETVGADQQRVDVDQRRFNGGSAADQRRPPFVALIVTPDQHLAADYNLIGGDCTGLLFRIFFVVDSGGEMIPYRLRPIIDSSTYSLDSIMDSIKAIKEVN